MPTIQIDYNEKEQAANISIIEEASIIVWSSVRRFFEDRYPKLVQNRRQSLRIPWWAFLSLRQDLRDVLAITGADLSLSDSARKLLLDARTRAEEYDNADQLTRQLLPDQINEELASVGFARQLLPYQCRNVAFLSGLSAGASFSVPGAGKTTEALAYFFLTRKPEDRLLVIAPKSAFVAWEDELPVCVPGIDFEFVRLTGGEIRIHYLLGDDPRAILISYHQLPRVIRDVATFLANHPVYMFIDESHRMKRGVEGVHGQTILSMAHLPRRKLILSGTPMPNSEDDLTAQFNFLYPECRTGAAGAIDRIQSVFVRTTKSELGLIPPRRIENKI